MKVLIDTCVVSELQKTKPNSKVVDIYSQLDSESIFLSVITIGELAKGIHLLTEGKRKKELLAWFKVLKKDYQDKILNINIEVILAWALITAQAQKTGHLISARDGLIAATAKHFGLSIMTRNVGDFQASGVDLINPWD